jgi:diguanylate cyclase (GGDEF)-like protein
MIDLSDLIEAQLRNGFRRLRFVPLLESAFQQHHAQHAVGQRLLMLVIAAILVAAMPFVDGWLLNPPEAFMQQARWVQFGLMLPAILLAAACTADRRLRRFADPLGVIALLVVVGGWTYQRYIGLQMGYAVPAILIGVVLAAVFALAGLMFWAVAPAGVLGLLVYAMVEIGTQDSASVSWYDIVGLFLLALVTGLAGYLREHSERANWLRNKLLEQLALRDSLTGLLNHRSFRQLYRQTVNLARREKRPLLIAAIDVDRFKPFNDLYGHPSGDDCLVRITQLFRRFSQRSVDLVGRVGGDEFALVWYDIDEAAARSRLEALRREVEELAIPHRGHGTQEASVVTISVGATWLKPDDPTDADQVFERVDAALYGAKRTGRNLVVWEDRTTVVAAESAAARGAP